MKALQFTPVMRAANRTEMEATPIRVLTAIGASHALRLRDNGGLTATRLESGNEALASDCENGEVVAVVRHCRDSRSSEWVLVVYASNVGLNGLAPPLAAAVLEPGGLLTIGERCWLIVSLWQPKPVQAPAELQNKPCPVCGGELGRALVVQCGCGRWTHLENASAPHDTDALNCFTASGQCGGCGRPASLEPQMFPEVSERLASEPIDDEFAWQ